MEGARGLFWFDVVVPSGNGLNTLASHQEYGSYPSRDAARRRFLELAEPATKAGYYYLCSWGDGVFPGPRLFGSATPTPRPATRRDSGRLPEGEDPSGAECGASQSGRCEDSGIAQPPSSSPESTP